MMNFLLTAADPAAQGGGTALMLIQIAPLILIFVVFYFMLIRPQKKKEKEIQQMRSSLEVGDEIITSGGIIGRVVSLKDDSLVIETGSDRSKIRITRYAVAQNNTIHDNPQ